MPLNWSLQASPDQDSATHCPRGIKQEIDESSDTCPNQTDMELLQHL
jgi:hypothetical protein